MISYPELLDLRVARVSNDDIAVTPHRDQPLGTPSLAAYAGAPGLPPVAGKAVGLPIAHMPAKEEQPNPS